MTRRHSAILRLRTIEHRMAQLQLARARREEAQLSTMLNRIGALRQQQEIGTAMTSGAAMSAQCEMAIRLDALARATARELNGATATADSRQQTQNVAQQREDSAQRRLEKAEVLAARKAEITSASRYCRGSGNEQEDGE